MTGESFNWRQFLRRWQEEWVPREDEEHEGAEGGQTAFPLGRPGADEAAIAAAEERLGRRLPPSYREFLAVSDGWHVDETAGVCQLGGVADIDWFRDPYDMTPLYEQNLDDNPREEDVLLAGMWQRALQLETDSDMSYALLDPGDSDQDGEWALYVYRGWSGELPDRHPSFRAYMEATYRGFHSDRAERPDFANATTRAQDAQAEEARRLALCGQYEEALPLLEEALSFGRPHSAVLLNQIRHLLAPHGSQGYGDLVADPRYLPEILPVEAMTPARGEWRLGGDDHWLGMMTARGAARGTVESVLSTMRDGTHCYAPSGPWGRAVAEARESARWGATDAAWRVLREALPLWEAPGPLLIAPIGLLADPVLGPLITPERGREILATPRSGQKGPTPEPVPDLDPPGLVWLTESAATRRSLDGYRCVWVEGLDPARLPALIGEEGAELSAPTDWRTASWRAPQPHEREGVELWEDRAVVAVGRAAEAWAFAFDGHPRHLSKLSRSPAPAASSSGRAVVVWRDPRSSSSPGSHPAAFHLSVAEEGEELYAFTVRGTEVRRSGEIPEALDPARLFGPGDTELDCELGVLEALHTELGLSLPRFALTQGRLHTFTTRSWTRAPQADEPFAYAYISFGQHRR
ncbi:SMI1/KNR4 family protein [Streptomyces phaeofaciens JCM 4814]|uniref:Cell wall assembly protein n=1 Tax=Streptomyces phaeofaciens TaxID=68254 RepID=A0A918HQ05_9ACTN|nr:SMI1/KNR4 family protein [Streptomyces phaeofaciens]GGT93895.1 cell wall assembly protein [Streptomyces phaeofaciens]